MKKYMKKTCAVVLSALMASAVSGCSTADTDIFVPTLAEPQNAEVTTVRVERADVRVYKAFPTRVEPEKKEEKFAIDGVVGKVYVTQGQYVEKGTLLAELVVDTYEEEIPKLEEQINELTKSHEKENKQLAKQESQIESDLARLKREVRQTSGTARNQKRVEYELKQIEQEEFTRRKEARAQEQAEAETELREKLAELTEKVNSNKLYASVDGYILNQPLNLLGQRFHTEDPAFVIYDTQNLYVTTKYYTEDAFDKMAEHYAVIDGERVEFGYIELSEEQLKKLSVRAVPGSSISKVVQYHLDLKEGQNVQIGDYALAIFVTESRENVLTLPTDLVTYDGYGYHVYKYVDGVRKKVEVIPGLRDGSRVEILSGLEEGDIVYVQH